MEHFPGAAPAKKADVPAVRRVLKIFDLLAESHRGLRLSEISRKLGLPKSSTFRILQVLEEERRVQRSTQSGRYYLGPHLLQLNSAALTCMELRDRAKPFLVRLAQRTGLTVHMAVLERNQAVLIEKLEALGTPPIGTWVGRVMDMHSTAVGKALIAYLSPEDFLRQIKADVFVRHNRNTILTISQLRKELAEVRELGYAVDNAEDEVGSRCVGAPVLNGDGRVVTAISIVGTTTQFPEELIHPLGKLVKQTAATMSSRL